MCEKCPYKEFFSGPYFSVFSLNKGKYGPKKTPYLDTLHVVWISISHNKWSTFLGQASLGYATVTALS